MHDMYPSSHVSRVCALLMLMCDPTGGGVVLMGVTITITQTGGSDAAAGTVPPLWTIAITNNTIVDANGTNPILAATSGSPGASVELNGITGNSIHAICTSDGYICMHMYNRNIYTIQVYMYGHCNLYVTGCNIASIASHVLLDVSTSNVRVHAYACI